MKKIKQTIAKCDKKGTITGSIERWEAHEKGTLHRAFSIALIYKGSYILQHRKHPAFDGTYDLTSSSHQLMKNGKLQDTVERIYECLEREWGLTKKDFVGTPVRDGIVYYKAPDEKSEFIEHEMCDMYSVEIKKLPVPNLEVAYGYSMVTKKELTNKKGRIYSQLAPWTQVAISKKLI